MLPPPASCSLVPHASLLAPLANGLAVSLSCKGHALLLTYTLTAGREALLIPAAQPSGAADGLWAHTCLEVFVRPQGTESYREFNFSPSGQWAIYDFSAYRERRAAPVLLVLPQIEFRHIASGFVLTATVDRRLLPESGPWQLALSAVLEACDGRKAYWAVRHADSHPDFHSSESFCLDLPDF